MKRAILSRAEAISRAVLIVLALAAGGLARAQDLPDATLATSREVTMYIPPEGNRASAGSSREVTMYIPVEGQQATLATSREVAALFNYSLRDVKNALQIAAGLQAAPAISSWDFSWLNAAKADPSGGRIDILDAFVTAYDAFRP